MANSRRKRTSIPLHKYNYSQCKGLGTNYQWRPGHKSPGKVRVRQKCVRRGSLNKSKLLPNERLFIFAKGKHKPVTTGELFADGKFFPKGYKTGFNKEKLRSNYFEFKNSYDRSVKRHRSKSRANAAPKAKATPKPKAAPKAKATPKPKAKAAPKAALRRSPRRK